VVDKRLAIEAFFSRFEAERTCFRFKILKLKLKERS
jgi:hypothetical protein